MATADFHFYSTLFSKLDTALTSYVGDTATAIIGAITPVATTLITIYVMLWGWSMMRGVISEPIMDGVGRIVKLSLITATALQIGHYNGFLADMLWNSPDALAGYIGGGTPTTNAVYLDKLMSRMYDFGGAYYDKAYATTTMGIPSIGLLTMAYVLWGAGVLATGYGAFLLTLAKIGLAVALGVGPLFVLMCVFEPTKRFFDSWIGQALNYVFLVMLSAATIKLILAVLESYLTDASGAVLADPQIAQALPAIVFSIIGALALVQMPSMASALGGGVAIGTLGAVGWAYGKTRGTMAAMRPTAMRRSLNKARADARIVDRALGGAPSAVGRAATRPVGALYRKVTGARNRVSKG